MRNFESQPSIKGSRTARGTALILAAALTAGCHVPKHDGATPTSAPSGKASPIAPPSPTEFAPPQPPIMPKANLDKKPGSLTPCFAGDIALPPYIKPNVSLTLNPDQNGNLTGTRRPSAELQSRIAAATVRVRYNLGATHIEGSGAIINGQVATAAHVTYGQQLANMQVIENNGTTHRVTGGCYVYQLNGKRAKLDSSALERDTATPTDDLTILTIDGLLPGGLSTAAQPPRGTPLIGFGTPTPQKNNQLRFFTGIQMSDRSSTFQAQMVIGDTGESVCSAGQSGGPIVIETGGVVGLIGGSGQSNQPVLGANHAIVTSVEALGNATYTPGYVIDAAIMARRRQAAS